MKLFIFEVSRKFRWKYVLCYYQYCTSNRFLSNEMIGIIAYWWLLHGFYADFFMYQWKWFCSQFFNLDLPRHWCISNISKCRNLCSRPFSTKERWNLEWKSTMETSTNLLSTSERWIFASNQQAVCSIYKGIVWIFIWSRDGCALLQA